MADRAFDERQGQLNEVIRQAAERGLELTKDLLPMDEQTMRRLERRWDQFDAAMMRRVVTAVRMLSAKSREEDEEVPSQFGYLKGYKQVHMGMEQLTGYVPKSVSWQIGRLHEILPQLGDADETIAEGPLPEGAESWFAIPRWELLAPTYGEAVEKALDLINQFSPDKIYSYRTGRLGPEYLRPYEPSEICWQKICEEQKDHDILIIPAQFGIRYRGCTFQRARERMTEKEFGLGAYAVLMMLLLHPERLRDFDDLWMECPGDMYSPDADGRYVAAPLIFHYRGEIEFDIYEYTHAKLGSVTGFMTE